MSRKFTPPRAHHLLMSLLLCCAPWLAHAQGQPLATVKITDQDSGKKEKTLEEALNDVQAYYKISFIYESDVVANKMTPRQIRFEADVESTLEKILKPLDLKVKKINDNSYAISPLKAPEAPRNNQRKPDNNSEDRIFMQVSGQVVDENDSGLPGVNVIEKGTSNGTTTDVDGKFTLNVAGENSVLIFSFIGYDAQEITVGARTDFSIKMAIKAESLGEVVVVGYGTQKKANLTGAVGAVDSKEIEKLNVNQTTQLLQGQVAGVTVIQQSGQPGKENAQISIRGQGTFSGAGTNPLVLVDGLASSMDNVDFNDIASISVLKDAASASIYGTRAANGVVLIETKKGKEGKTKINYHGYVGLQQPTEIPKIVDSWTYAEMMNEALTNDGQNPQYSAAEIAKFKSGEDPDNYANKNHYRDLITSGSGVQTGHNINMTGGNGKTNYLVSFGYLNNQGLMAETYFKRYNVRMNLENKINDKVKVSLILSGRASNQNEPTAVDKSPVPGAEGILSYAIKVPTTIPGRKSNGYYGNQTGFTTEGWMDSESFIANDNKNLYSNASIDWDIVKGLKLTGRMGYDFTLNQYTMFRPTLVIDQFLTAGPSDLTKENTTTGLLTAQSFLNYDLNIGRHSIHALLGYSQESYKQESLRGFRDNFPSNTLSQLNAGSASNQQSSGTASEWALRSVFGRVTYNFNERYLLEFNARYDGSSRFPSAHRFGLFPSLSGGWRISEEDFFHVSWIDELKVRGSIGKLGNQNIGTYPYQQLISLGLNAPFGATEVMSPGAAAKVVPNSNLSWETTRVIDGGIDVAFFSGKLNFTADYYDKLTSGILYAVSASAVLGLTPSVQNAGVVSNKGIDLELRYRGKAGDFTYSIAPNFSYVKNQVVELANLEKDVTNGWFVGYPLNAIYGYKAQGLFVDQADIDAHATQFRVPKPGTIKFEDISGPNGVPDGKVDADYDRTVIGNTFPKFTFGMNLNGQYKRFDLSILLQGIGGVNKLIGVLQTNPVTGAIQNNTLFQGNAFIQGSNPQQWMADDHWSIDNPNPNAAYPRLSILGGQEEQFQPSTFIMHNASFLRISNVQLGYTFAPELISKLRMSTFRIYVSARNLKTFDHFQKGWDPETAGGYPPVRVYNIGINVGF
jgi:TonB-linked SusC/RagA family outer membrane protein